MTYSANQKSILQKLLQKYENSKTYSKENLVSQSFSIKPEEIFKDYQSDFADINKIEEFEKQINLLNEAGFVEIKKKGGRIEKIIAVSSKENWEKVRDILGKKEKNLIIQEQIDFYKSKLDFHKIISSLCKNQIARLENGKKATYELDEAKAIIALLDFILSNKQEILERELSIAVLHDSKLWQSKYKSKVCKILKESDVFSDFLLDFENEDEKEINFALLEELNIFQNPTYIYFKGRGKIIFLDGNEITLSAEYPIAIASSAVSKIKNLTIDEENIMTVENLTSFNRTKDHGYFYLYLAGYHNSGKQNFLKKIHCQNQKKNYFHFSDLDPDGFYILQNLRAKTGIQFKPFKMNVEILQKYKDYAKTLEKNDIAKAKNLISKGLFAEEMNFMLCHNCKLEQEIISWKE